MERASLGSASGTGASAADPNAGLIGIDPMLIVRRPLALSGETFALGTDAQSIGRAPDNDIVLEQPHVSRHHAVIRRAGSAVIIEDSRSTTGTHVNGSLIDEACLLHAGDRIRLGEFELELLNGPPRPAPPDQTAVYQTASPPRVAAPRARFDIDSQQAGAISNVGRDQYNYEMRIAPMRRRARTLMWIGFALLVAGIAVFAVGWAQFAKPILDCVNHPNSCSQPGAGGFAVAACGSFLAILGSIVMVASLLMRRRARREEERQK